MLHCGPSIFSQIFAIFFSSLKLKDHVLHAEKTTGGSMVLYVLNLMFLEIIRDKTS